MWDNCTADLKNDIESVQNEAARIVSGATKLCNIHTLLADLRWDTHACRRRKHRLILLYKMKHGLTPNYLTHMIPNRSQDRYPPRNAESIPLLNVETQQYASSFLPATIRVWNSLSPETQQADTLHIFKSKLQTHPRRSTLLYNVSARRNQILHCRLRLGFSSLNHDLHRKTLLTLLDASAML